MTRTIVWACFASAVLFSCTTTEPPRDDAGPRPPCEGDADCSDGLFCTGTEHCMPGDPSADARGCVLGELPCTGATSCHEASARCLTECGLGMDADGDGAQASECGGTDCDDSDPERHPGAVEVCDLAGADEDCDPATLGDRDADGDGSVDARCCNGSNCGDDCLDGEAGVHPGATEACNTLDDDCDGAVDEGVLVSMFADGDRDLHGDPSMPRMACPGAGGLAEIGDDCDDADPRRHPAQVEICDLLDNDCNGTADDMPQSVTWYRDLDGDGFGSPESGSIVACAPPPGHELRATDCDDARAGVSPAAIEQCNGVDDDCNGRADYVVAMGDLEDDDGDTHPDAACERGSDCDDRDPSAAPGIDEICDGRDNDCDGVSDDGTSEATWYPDRDGDGWGDAAGTTITTCTPPRGYVLRIGDCDDSIPSRHPFARDACDGRDDDCDGTIDEDAAAVAYFPDDDGDGFGDAMRAVLSCTTPAGLIPIGGDCEDGDSLRRPGATELCNGIDDDCDGTEDEGFPSTSCGTGACRRTVATCSMGMPAACVPGSPGTELCNGIDDDCDGTIDDEPGASADCASRGTGAASTIAGCESGACVVRGCVPGYADCNASGSDGCEVNLRVDVASCGACGHQCEAFDSCDAPYGCVQEPIEIGAGDRHTCTRLGGGAVYCWGANDEGQLGNGVFTPSAIGVQTPSIAAARLSVGHEHACAVQRDRTLRCWGRNVDAQGGGGASPLTSPQQIWTDTDWIAVAAGDRHTCGLRGSGTIHCFGQSAGNLLGGTCGTATCGGSVAVTVGSAFGGELAAGASATLVREIAPAVRLTGFGTSAAFGGGMVSGTSGYAPALAGAAPITDAISICAGDAFSCAVRAGGTVVCAGDDDVGQLGTAASSTRSATHRPVDGITTATRVDCGHAFACATLSDGSISCWGRSLEGQILGSTGLLQDVPVALGPLPGRVIDLGLGEHHGCAILDSQRVVCWGRNVNGQLGANDFDPHPGIVFVVGLP